jgi:ATP-dependent Clp protease, protease subunit
MRNTEQGPVVGGPLWPRDEMSGPHFVPGLPHDEWLRVQLFQRRTVMLTGELDDQTANALAMALMTLDADGDDAVHLRIDSGGGSVACALALMDVIDLLGVPVGAVCMGQAVGPAVGVLAVCSRRILAPHARLGILEPTAEFGGTAHQIEQLASAHVDRWTVFCTRLGEATGQPVDRILEDASRGCFLTAEQALDYGLADELASPDSRITSLPGHSIGFGRGGPA